ncbi:MAG: 5-(carboxyamino)imidazole ribonucleotide synthase, partial [Terriglobia bacterium]
MKIGVLGGGQLGRMMALAGYPLGLHLRFLDRAADASAGQV